MEKNNLGAHKLIRNDLNKLAPAIAKKGWLNYRYVCCLSN